MIGKGVSFETRVRFFELVCAGSSVRTAAGCVGVSGQSAWEWWHKRGPMTLTLAPGKRGGLAGAGPSARFDSSTTAQRCGARRPLTSEDRAVIASCLHQRNQGAEVSLGDIGALLGRDKSVISREIRRHRARDGLYYPALAHREAHESRKRPKPFRLAANPVLRARVEAWIDAGWSPKLIATILKRDHPGTIMDRVSHETIYQALYVQSRGLLRQDLYRRLSTQRPRRKPRTGQQRHSTSPYREALKISQRPPEVADRAVPGHWEGDLVIGANSASAVGTLVERATRFTILLHLPGRHDADTVAEAMIREMSDLPEHLRQSLTWDRGTEMARYDKIQLDLKMPVYFCDPHSPWQRGTNENTNRLLRHWLTKGTDLSRFSAADLRRIAASLNARPRPTLDLQTPAQALDALLRTPSAA